MVFFDVMPFSKLMRVIESRFRDVLCYYFPRHLKCLSLFLYCSVCCFSMHSSVPLLRNVTSNKLFFCFCFAARPIPAVNVFDAQLQFLELLDNVLPGLYFISFNLFSLSPVSFSVCSTLICISYCKFM